MYSVLYRVMGLIGLLLVSSACWLIIVSLIAFGAFVAGMWHPWGELPGGFVPCLVVACIAWFYIDLYVLLVQWSMVLPFRECLHEVLAQSACLLWYPAGMMLVPLIIRSVFGFQGQLAGTFVVGWLIAWGLARLTLTARVRLDSTDGSHASSGFGGRPPRPQ